MKTASVKQTKKFMAEVSKLAPEEFLGLAKVLCVQIFNQETKEPRDFYDILGDVIGSFAKLGKSQRKEIMVLLQTINRGEKNGNETSDSEAEK